jgi:CubicO group peptidase (beta-lactamase class C family)
LLYDKWLACPVTEKNMNKFNRMLTLFILLLISLPSYADDIPKGEQLAVDTAATTVLGNAFIAPAEWSMSVRGPATFIEAPEGGSRIVLVDVKAADADAAMAAGWAAYKTADWPLKVADDQPDEDGWSNRRRFEYQTSPNERRYVVAGTMFANGAWTVWIYDMADDVGGKRGAQVSLLFSSLLPKGYDRETFRGREPHQLDAARIAELSNFVTEGQKASGVPGVSVGIIQDGEIVFSGGFGVRELGKPEKVDGDTLYMIASNSKGLTTLLLAKLVESGKVSWKDPVTKLLPQFKLGDADTTRQVLVEHLVCACTGLPRQDMEWLLEFGGLTPEGAMETLATMQPTTRFGEMFQYSNTLAAAGGFVAGHVVYPDLELGLAYDKAMQTIVFNPLSMNSTTFDYGRAQGSGNHASAHSADVNGKTSLAVMEVNYAAIPVRPAGAAWSSVNDMLRYIAMELQEGVLPTGERYIAKGPLLERRVAKVPLNKDASYGMGLMVDETYGTQVVHHGGDMIGYHSDMMWLPEHGVGAVILTNGDPGWLIRSGFQRKLLEVLFDGNEEADIAIASSSERFFSQMKAERDLLVLPADAEQAAALGKHYSSDQLGDILVSQTGDTTVFDFGEWKSEVGSRTNPDGTVSFITTVPGMVGLELVVGSDEENTLILRDAQHEYVFKEL